jgi:hypothetical protein
MREIDTIDIKYRTINRAILVGWVAFYWVEGEGFVRYSSDIHDWLDLPKIGVQYLYRIYDDGVKEQIAGTDYYCPYQLMYTDDVNPFVKFGLYLDDDTYRDIVVPQVMNDPINF